MDYKEWGDLKKGDRIKDILGEKGVVLCAIGIGKLIKWDDGRIERVQHGCIELDKSV
jgi:Tfp pilus assembly protein PilP